jgi:uncharacterized protein involved in response to NO
LAGLKRPRTPANEGKVIVESAMAGIPRLRDYRGPALLSYGFRPFFLLGAIYSGLAIVVWVLMVQGQVELTSVFVPRDWHVHEMLYGFVPAIVTGFHLTAIPNWTGRLPLQGLPLLVLVGTWFAGRVAVACSASIGWITAGAIDVAFLMLVAAAAAREIMAGKNWGNLKVVTLVGLLAAGNLIFHLEAHLNGSADYAIRLGVGTVVLLISLVGGRVVPSFTRNWLAQKAAGRLPRPFERFDIMTIVVSAVALLFWIVLPSEHGTGFALGVAGVLQIARLARWVGDRTFSNRLVLVLHAGYFFVPLGFLMVGGAVFGMIPSSAGIHAWTGGAGVMMLAVMTRASLGHTGWELTASAGTQAVYAVSIIAVLARIWASMHQEWSDVLLSVSGTAWAAAFFGFAALYGPMLCTARRSRRL